jgi:hypothetical protein
MEIVFDKMSIRERLNFNQKFGCIESFENLGSHGRTCNVANLALVFMLRGLRKKWMQLAAYGNTQGQMLVTS